MMVAPQLQAWWPAPPVRTQVVLARNCTAAIPEPLSSGRPARLIRLSCARQTTGAGAFAPAGNAACRRLPRAQTGAPHVRDTVASGICQVHTQNSGGVHAYAVRRAESGALPNSHHHHQPDTQALGRFISQCYSAQPHDGHGGQYPPLGVKPGQQLNQKLGHTPAACRSLASWAQSSGRCTASRAWACAS